MNLPHVAIIVAGGKGLRMNAEIPKQFLEINHLPILMHTLNAFSMYDASIQLILVLPAEQVDYWKELCLKHSFSISHTIVSGGDTRFDSVKNGLDAVKVHSMVAVHDGVRPLVSRDTIARCFEQVYQYGAVIPTVELVDSIRQLTDGRNIAVDRSAFQLVQTPQVFDSMILRNAYNQEFSSLFTDDASVVEAAGTAVKLVQGNRENIKITTEMDLKIASLFL
jgi:2-C-methyl-D-erythritol 4-phosphate cytidylyltransferase